MLACHYLLIFLQLHHYNSTFIPLFALTSLPQVSKGKLIPIQTLGFQEVEVPRLQDMKVVSCQPHTLAASTPWKYSCYSILVEAESTPGP